MRDEHDFSRGKHGVIIPSPGKTRFTIMIVAVVALAMGSGLAWNHPVAPAAVLAAFLLWCAVVAWRPGIWLFIVPAALPLLNFGPWTGWVVFEEFDLLLLGVVTGAYARMALAPATQRGGSERSSATVRPSSRWQPCSGRSAWSPWLVACRRRAGSPSAGSRATPIR